MFLKHKSDPDFSPILEHVLHTYDKVICSGAAAFVIHNDTIVLEEYIGKQSIKEDARIVQEDTQFHAASVRKSYIGFAAAYAVYHGYIKSIDELVLNYLPGLEAAFWENTTIRHLLTHTHGLSEKEGSIYREFPAGEGWSYRQIGVTTLNEIIKRTTEKTISEILHEQVFVPLGFKETNWHSHKNEQLVDVILRYEEDGDWKTSDSTAGDKMNMYISARELAFWGYFHLKEGNINGKQIVPKEMIRMAVSLQSPATIERDLPQNGFLWFVKDVNAKKTEIGEHVPKRSFQILGYTGVTLLAIPEQNLVAVRMFNSFGSPEGHDYLADVRSFGDTVIGCVNR
ncbi:serine hydrolase domain-containing protein [Peribacillus sp. SCS-26]|uniref:serine hydrolase domain-containing protein n=1 Tax=Paraperibacillus marinus TaxID=3115295 RepID=UPI0039057B8E